MNPQSVSSHFVDFHHLSNYIALTKPRVGFLVVFTTTVGFFMAPQSPFDLWRLLQTLIAAFLMFSGSATINQCIEFKTDGLMVRTQHRPLPSGYVSLPKAYTFGLLLSILGILYMGIALNWLASCIGVITAIIYLFFYTPMKRKTIHNVAVGALSGALPPLGGWAAASGLLTLEAWLLSTVLFFWQFVHFFPIAWIYREDYARGGHCMLPCHDPKGKRVAFQVMFFGILLSVVSLIFFVIGYSTLVYFVFAVCLNISLLDCCWAFVRFRDEIHAKQLARFSQTYLALLLGSLVMDAFLFKPFL